MPESTTDEQSIREVVGFYVDGIHNGNTDLLKKAFHPRAMMYGSSPNSVTIIEIDGLYGFVNANVPPSKSGDLHKCTISSVERSGNAASVVMREESVFGHDYTNYFQLLKIDGRWVIVSKAYNATEVK